MFRFKEVLTVFLAALSLVPTSQAQPLIYEGKDGIGKGKHIVFLANDHEYRSEQTCPQLAKILAKHHGFKCTVLFGVDDEGYVKSGAKLVPHLDALQNADMLFLFARFMSLPEEQAGMIAEYFERGGPVVGVRTSTHSFNGQGGKWAKLNYNYAGEDYRGGLGEQIFGNTWHKERGQSHYGSNNLMGCRITAVPGAKGHPVLQGVKNIHAYSGAYESKPPADATPLLQVQVLNTFGPSDDLNTDKPTVNAGWARDYYVAPSGTKKDARSIYTSFGASEDLLSEDARRFLLNACLWAGGWESAITPDLDVTLVGKFSPSAYGSGAFYYEGIKPLDLAGFDSEIMPSSARLGGVDDPKGVARVSRALVNRPELQAKLAELYPDLYGPNAKQ